MKNILKYEGFIGLVSFSAENEVFYGRLEGIDELVIFEGSTVEELKSAFKEAVEDYLVICKEVDKSPIKSYKDSFNVRVQPKTHQKAFLKATEMGVSLNQLVEKALDLFLLKNEEK